jgi:DNA-binding transcriptional LysR family regulator
MQRIFTVELGQLRTLRELRERGTVTATAQALHLTPSAVSQQLAALSRSVGAPLLARHGRRVRLTQQAIILLEHADRMHAELEAAQAGLAAFEDGRAGTVSVGAFATAITGLVVPALEMLARERPGISMRVGEAEPPACLTSLDTGELDIAVTVDYALGPSRDDPRYHRTELRRDPLRLVVPSAHPRAGGEILDIRDLAGEAWVTGATGHPCSEITMAACTAAGVSPKIAHRVDSWEAAIALVACGAGVAMAPELALGAHHPGVSVLAVRPGEPARNVYAAVRSGSQDAPHIAAVLAALSAAAAAAARHEPPGQEDHQAPARRPRPAQHRPAAPQDPQAHPAAS